MNRDASIFLITNRSEAFDIIIVGGGATGLGAALDAASRGHSVLLIEKTDFAKGTSSRSTKLIHGGVRYLQQGNISLVRESLKERGILKGNAPHLISKQAFVIPSYKWWESHYYTIGLKMYDVLAGKRAFGSTQRLTREETLEHLPNLNPKGLSGGVLYYDGQFDDARLAAALASTANQMGATLINYMECLDLIKEDGKVVGLNAVDHESGKSFEIRAKTVINATGVNVDALRSKDDPSANKIIAPSQGIHFVLPKRFLPGGSAMMIPKTNDGRVLFAVPWKDCVLLGTTDTPIKDILEEPVAFEEEIKFLFEHASKYFESSPKQEDILSIYAGLRPLVKDNKDASTSSISRDHSITVTSSGLISIAGGKWTTYRKMAEDVIDQAEKTGGMIPHNCITASLPLQGTANRYDDSIYSESAYGTNLRTINAIAKAIPGANKQIHAELPNTIAEVIYSIRHEMARTVDDVLARRTRSLILNAQASVDCSHKIATILASELGKDEEWIQSQIKTFSVIAQGYLANSINAT